MDFKREDHNRIIAGNDETGFVTSQSVEANLLFAILEKLEEIRCGIIDVEDVIQDAKNVCPDCKRDKPYCGHYRVKDSRYTG